ncbi:hypothetical protein DVS28_b0280 (plasmid) [Euzebya pacifica]|uniref:Uncharacterized protein n=1 Tax=Euzebya pacifica TaxID=1608957 RepID=A0A346Y6F3_9ACTN|nr:hypothetical protein DVS28_b0280 [Euzebya pacifica]
MAAPGATCGASHPKAGQATVNVPAASTAAAAADPFAVTDFDSIVAGFDGPATESLRDEADTETRNHVKAAAKSLGGRFPTPSHAWGSANQAVTASMAMLSGAKDMPIPEQIARLEGAAHNLLVAAAVMRAVPASGNGDPGDTDAAHSSVAAALASATEHGTLSLDPDNDNVRTARAYARKLAVDAMQGLDTANPTQTSAEAADRFRQAAQWLTRGVAVIKNRDNDAHQAKKLGAGGLALPAIGSNQILETPEEAQDNAMAFYLSGAADGADDWLKGMDGE